MVSVFNLALEPSRRGWGQNLERLKLAQGSHLSLGLRGRWRRRR